MGPLILLGLGAAGAAAVFLATKDDDDAVTSATGTGGGGGFFNRNFGIPTSSLPPRPPGVSAIQWEAIHHKKLERPEGMPDDQWAVYQAKQSMFAGDGHTDGYGGDIYGGDIYGGDIYADSYAGIGDWLKDRWEDTKTGWKYMDTVYREDGPAAVVSESVSAGGYAGKQALTKTAAAATREANEKMDEALAAVEKMAAARAKWEAAVNKMSTFDQVRERSGMIPRITALTSGFMDNQVRRSLEAARGLGGSWEARANKISADLQRSQWSGVYGIDPVFGVVPAIPMTTSAVIIAGCVTIIGLASVLYLAYTENTTRICIEKGIDCPPDAAESLAKAAPWIGGAVIVTGLLYKGLPALQQWKGQGNYYDGDDGPDTDYIDW
jgi:hypothetical protein